MTKENLQELIQRTGLKKQKVAAILDVTPAHLSRLLGGATKLTPKVIRKTVKLNEYLKP